MEKIFSKRNIKIFNWIFLIVLTLIFEFGYCNLNFTTAALTKRPIDGFNFSLCRGVVYIAMLVGMYFINKTKMIEDISESFKSKTKKIAIITYVVLAMLAIAIYAYKFLVKQELALIHFSMISIALILGFNAVEYLTKKYYTNIIALFLVGITFCLTVNAYHVLDEKRHFMSAYNLSYGNLNFDNAIVDQQFMIDLPRGTHYTSFVNFFGEKYKFQKAELPADAGVDSLPAGYNPIIYIPSAIGILIGRILQGSVADIFLMGRIFNLISYTLLVALIIKLLPYKKNVFLAILTIPMFLLFSATYSVDGIGTALVTLFVAYFFKMYADKENISLKDLIILLGIYTLVLSFKSMSYIFIGFLIFLLPLKDIIKKYKTKIPLLLIGFIVVNVLVLLIQPKIHMSDNRYDNVSAVDQAKSVLHNPIVVLEVMKNQVESKMLNYTWLKDFNAEAYLSERANSVFFVMLIYYFYVAFKDDSKNFSLKEKIIILTTFVLTFGFTSGILFVACAPVGVNYVVGYQTRYIFPIVALIMICLSNKNLKNENNEEDVMKISIMQIAFIMIGVIGAILK